MKFLTACTDSGYCRPAAPSWLHQQLSRYVQDERDMLVVYLLLRISVTLFPLAALLLMSALRGGAWWCVLAVYLGLSNLVFKGPFGLMLPCPTHRMLFKKQYGWLTHLLARHFVQLDGVARPEAEVIALLRARTRRLPLAV